MDASSNVSNIPDNTQKRPSGNVSDVNSRLKAGIFLTSVAGIASLAGFFMTLASARKKDPKMFQRGSMIIDDGEGGIELALRALKWGTFYAVTGCSLIWYGIWKLSGAHTMEEFRYKMGTILPRIPKNESPEGRKEFEGLTDLLTYLSTVDNKESKSP